MWERLWGEIWECRAGVGLFFVTLFGSVLIYVLSNLKGFNNSEVFLRRFFPGKNDTFYIRLDFLIMCFAGAVIGTIVYAPGTVYQSLAAGVGWTGAMNILLSPRTDTVGKPVLTSPASESGQADKEVQLNA